MKRSLVFLASLGLAMLWTSQAQAQYRRNERVIIQLKVDSWTPHEGEVGTLVTLSGSGFTRKMQILVGGRTVPIVQIGARELSFRVPSSYGNGSIVLRKPGLANDYTIGTFNVWASPNITGFSPAFGTAGTRVEIRGQNFTEYDRVHLGPLSVPVDRWSANSLIVTIPEGAVSNHLSVKNQRSVEARSSHRFTVVAPAPYISSFTPTRGQPGTIVRISGGNYDSDIRVSYGQQSVPISRTGNGWIEVAIPSNADKSWPLSISSQRGGATAATYFDLELAPAVSSFAPSWGHIGSRVTLRGSHFAASDRVSIAGQFCKIVQLRGDQITVELPANAQSASFVVHRGAQSVATATAFEVVYQPHLASVSPLQGTPGTQVRVTGSHLDGSKIYLGNTEIRPGSIRAGQITLVIPQGATSGPLRLISRGGEASWATPFDVWNVPSINGVSPVRGPAGTTVTISGNMLGNASQFFVGDIELPVISRVGDTRVVVSVPNTASDGMISSTAYGKNTPTNWRFDVVEAPIVSSFSPTEGSAGTAISIVGSGFDAFTRVFYGNDPVRVVRWDANRLSVEIPRNARRSEYLRVQGVGGAAQATVPFALLSAPTLARYSDYGAKPGAEITLWGDALALDTVVSFGTSATRVLRVNRDNSIVVAVPTMAPGQYELSVQHRGMRSVGRKRFVVHGWAQVNAISPGRAKVGDTIMLSGSGLADAQIWYGSHRLPVQRADRLGRRLWVQIPEGCAGKSPLTVVDGPNKATTEGLLVIEGPAAPPPPPKVRDHRDKKGKGRGPKVRDHRRGKSGY